MSEYAEKFKDPRWQKMRLQVLERDMWCCQICYDNESTLHIHHRYYKKGADPWDYPMEALVTLCEDCHQSERADRKAAEESLLFAMREKFMANDVLNIAAAIHDMELRHTPDIVSFAFSLAFENIFFQDAVIDAYFALVKKQYAEKEEVSA